VTGRAEGAARRYARALLDVALQQGDPEALRGELRDARATLEGHKELRAALEHPALSAEAKRKVVEAVWGGRASKVLARLLGLLADRGRVGLLPAIEQSYGALWNAHRRHHGQDDSPGPDMAGADQDDEPIDPGECDSGGAGD